MTARCTCRGRVDGGHGVGEGGERAVAGRLEHVPAVRFDGLADDRVVAFQFDAHRVGLLLPQARRALDVGEQERHDARGSLRHGAIISR